MKRRLIFYMVICLAFSANLCAQPIGDSAGISFAVEQETAPGMILIEGQSFYVREKGNNKTTTLASFYIGRNEETNGQYLAYLKFLRRYYSRASYEKALPDTLVWLRENLADSLKKYLAKNYLRGACFKDYPVVGVSPEQVEKYAIWKTDRVNEMILIREGLFDFYSPLDSSYIFTTETFLRGTWKGMLKSKLPDFNGQTPEREIRMEDALVTPNYRLITAEEWYWANYAVCMWQKSCIKTPKEIRNRKFDKKHYFDYLYVTPHKNKTCPKLLLSSDNASLLKEVYNTSGNAYLINGMHENVSELAVDSNQKIVVMGGSWKDKLEVTQTNTTKADSNRNDTMLTVPDKTNVSATIGFRLAMDYVGPLNWPYKRRRTR